jgi:hypothetical protein
VVAMVPESSAVDVGRTVDASICASYVCRTYVRHKPYVNLSTHYTDFARRTYIRARKSTNRTPCAVLRILSRRRGSTSPRSHGESPPRAQHGRGHPLRDAEHRGARDAGGALRRECPQQQHWLAPGWSAAVPEELGVGRRRAGSRRALTGSRCGEPPRGHNGRAEARAGQPVGALSRPQLGRERAAHLSGPLTCAARLAHRRVW